MSNNNFSLDDDESGIQESEQPQASHEEDYASEAAFAEDRRKLADFLQYPKERRKLSEFLQDTYKAYEQEAVDRTINRVIHEHDSEMQGATDFYKPGHIGPLMYQYLNMVGVEAAFASGLQHTKSSMTKTVQQKVDEINTLLRGVGGFNRQIKASFSRSAVNYLEAGDPLHPHREKVIFTVNLGDFELRYPMDESAEQTTVEDGRTLRRLVWDEAVNTLSEIVSNTGMKPKYVKNDKNSCIMTMQQYLLSEGDEEPDEFFTFNLRHVNPAMKQDMIDEYMEAVDAYNKDIALLKKQMNGFWVGREKRDQLNRQIDRIVKQRDFYIGTHPDPREMDPGLMFSIAVNTLKDYGVTKDKMQVIMTKYILALSTIAVDKSMDQQVNTVYQFGQKKAQDFQSLTTSPESEYNKTKGGSPSGGKGVSVVMKNDLVKKAG